ncbi:MAG: glucose-1-phosphate cytidylyltransferase [Bdellovibrionaceae bacterium]|nr:glucose-1-phosphate cytidylyltransferase [Pseudobdellovibrionaceae bacterium]
MKTVILCGGLGTRLSEETTLRPKPMVEIGGRPILWHIMNTYGSFGHKDFVLALGYKAEFIKEYFLNYHALNSDFQVSLDTGKVEVHKKSNLDFKVDLIDTGLHTLTGGRLLRLRDFLYKDGTFMLTYGDGVCNVDVNQLIDFHKSHGKIATVTAVRPGARFGGMKIENGKVINFQEKPQSGEGWINGGFFVFEPQMFDYLENDQTILERAPMENLVKDGQLMTFEHGDFWQCMDTVRDKQLLESLWENGDAPWKLWE